jgi:hypothetical protein
MKKLYKDNKILTLLFECLHNLADGLKHGSVPIELIGIVKIRPGVLTSLTSVSSSIFFCKLSKI